jgi:eukaryotic-like serine/threonine-protein kinase
VEQAADFVLQACEAIAEAHALGIIHRDLKPANLFVIQRPDRTLCVKVLDFGISKSTSLTGSDLSVTKTSAMMGSPLYMAPEQMESAKNVDARGDIWALGVILYELVTGRVPFLAESLPELIVKLLAASPPSMQELKPGVPPAFEAVVMRCLRRDRGQRYQNVAELALALADFAPRHSRLSVRRISGVLQGAGLAATALPPSSDQSIPPPGGSTAAAWGQTAPLAETRTSSTGLIVAVTGLMLAGAAGIVLFLIFGSSGSISPEPTPAAPETAAAAPAAPPPPMPTIEPVVTPPTPPAPKPVETQAAAEPPAPPEPAPVPNKAPPPAPARPKATTATTSAPTAKPPAPATKPPAPTATAAPQPAPKAPSPASLFDDRK